MKNSEEFRRLVFEKAEAYEKRRRARNRKIAGSVISFALILALTLPISLHLYHQNANPTEETTPAETMAFTTTAAETTSIETFLTTTEATTYATTTRAETTTEWTYPTTTIETTKPSPTTTVMTTTETSTTEQTTTWVPDISWTTTKPEPPGTTTAEEAEKPIHLLGDHRTTGFCRYDLFIEHYHGQRVLVKVITSENDLLTYLEEHAPLYGGKIMDVLNVYDVNFFRDHVLLIIESPHRIKDITAEDDHLSIRLHDGMSNGSHLNLITMGKHSSYSIDSVWH